MIISHNTFTYKKPVRAWMRLLTPFARCQKNAVAFQPVDCADIRLRMWRGEWRVCHGPCVYCTLEDALVLLDLADIRNVRLLFHTGKGETWSDFLELGALLLTKYPGFKFYCGRDRKTWDKVLAFEDIEVDQCVGSMRSRYGKLLPALWHRLNRKAVLEALENLKNGGHLALDFV